MKFHYVLTLQLRGHDPLTYKGTVSLPPGATSSGLFNFVTGESLREMGRPDETNYSVIFWFAGPEVLVPEVGVEVQR